MIKDMTRGDALRLIVLFAIPIFIGNVFQQFYQLADIYIVGHLIGERALAAVGASAPIYFMFLIVAFSFTGGLTAVTAQRFGAKDFEGMRRSVTHSIRASLVLSVVLTLILFVSLKRLMMVLNVPEGIFEESYRFILILGAGTILIVALNLLSGFIRAAGDSRTPLFFLVFTSVLNVVFNFVLIKYCGFGVEGSAFGTVLSILVSDVLCLWYMFKKFPLFRLKKGDWAFSWAFMREHLNIAVPMSIQYSILALSIMVIQAVCNSFGEKVIVGFTIALRFEQLATQPL
ncbi:MAG: MATE family efflux transporter, partial [Alphaproteobacteria bacterium]|nr:MATE family efflux transporter [Alphaproteobacteria bacterium]